MLHKYRNIQKLALITFLALNLLLDGICGMSMSVYAQDIQTENTTITQLEIIDSQAQILELNQLSERELRESIKTLQANIIETENTILLLENKRDEAQNTLTRLKDIQRRQENGELEFQEGEIEAIQNLNPEINKLESELLSTETELARQISKKEADENTLFLTEQKLGQRTNEVENQTSVLQSELFNIFSRYSIYFLLIVIYFVSLQLINMGVDKFVKHELARDIVKFVTAAIVTIASVVTVLIAFIGNLTYLLTGLGVISAALVVALQDFVSSFFAFMWIKVRGLFRNNDVVQINSGDAVVTGVVVDIGIFRTTLKELFGDDELNAERPSGRTVSVPNNIIMKTPIVNYTQDNRLLWHVLEITITFESDFELARTLLEGIVDKQFKYALDHKDQLLDEAYNLKYVYRPRVFMSIADSGPKFSLWFSTRYGHYREVLEILSADILHSFQTHGIDLAYNTTRIIPTPHNNNDSSITFHNNPHIIAPG